MADASNYSPVGGVAKTSILASSRLTSSSLHAIASRQSVSEVDSPDGAGGRALFFLLLSGVPPSLSCSAVTLNPGLADVPPAPELLTSLAASVSEQFLMLTIITTVIHHSPRRPGQPLAKDTLQRATQSTCQAYLYICARVAGI